MILFPDQKVPKKIKHLFIIDQDLVEYEIFIHLCTFQAFLTLFDGIQIE